MKKLKSIIKIIFIIGIFLLVLNCYLQKEKSPLENKLPITIFQIQSGSMMPEIKIKEIIIILKSKDYKENEIITYKANNSYFITHRIIAKTEEGYITKGDFNNTEDSKIVTKEQIQGKVIFHSRLLGKIYEFRYYLILILIILLLI